MHKSCSGIAITFLLCAVLSFRHAPFASAGASQAAAQQNRPVPRKDVSLRIMPMGDSITEGICDRPGNCRIAPDYRTPTEGTGIAGCSSALNHLNPSAVGYRGHLRDKLRDQGIRFQFVGSVVVAEGLAHEGHSKWTMADLDYCIQNAGLLERFQPDIILLHVGTNDAGWARTPDEMARSLRMLIDSIYRHVPKKTEVIVARIVSVKNGLRPYFMPSNTTMNETIRHYNAKIPELVRQARSSGKHVSVVDMSSVVESDSDLDPAGLHPNTTASQRMADAWAGKIREIMDRQR